MKSLKATSYRSPSTIITKESINPKLKTLMLPNSSNRNLTIASLTQSKSQNDFYNNFRAKAGLLVRALKEKSNYERIAQSQVNISKKIDHIKAQNEFHSLRCDMKNEFLNSSKNRDHSRVYSSNLNREATPIKKSKKKQPVPITSYRFDINILPEPDQKFISFKDLQVYLKYKFDKPQRFAFRKSRYL